MTDKQAELDRISRATRDAAEKFTADAIAAGKEIKPPEGFVPYPPDYADFGDLELEEDRERDMEIIDETD